MEKYESAVGYLACNAGLKVAKRTDKCGDCEDSFICSCVHNVIGTDHPCPFSAQWLLENEPKLHDECCKLWSESFR